MASLLYVNVLGVNLEHFGLHLGSLTLAFGLVSIFSGKIIKILGKKASFYGSLFFVFACIITNVILITFNINNPYIITISMFFQSIGFVIPCNTLFPLAISIKKDASGKVSALIATLKWIATIIGVQSASFFYTGAYFPIGFTIVIMLLLSIMLCAILWKEDDRLGKTFLGNYNPPSPKASEIHL
jgi:MFS family permease